MEAIMSSCIGSGIDKMKIAFIIFSSISVCFGMMDMEELKSVYYGIDIRGEPLMITKEIPEGAVQVTSKFGQIYQCTFPDHASEEKKKEEEEKLAIQIGIVEMLKPLSTKDCLFKSKDWWSYEFCYGKYIRQFHMEEGEIKGNIIYLGYYGQDFDWTNETAKEDRIRSKNGFHRYHSQTYHEGTKCDLTGEPRKAEVRFVCEENAEDYLSRIDESETCVYTVTVVTSRICRHPYLKAPVRRRPVPITCNPLLEEESYHDFILEREEEKQRVEILKTAKQQGAFKVPSMQSVTTHNPLESAMSTVAKDLLAKPVVERLPTKDLTKKSQLLELFPKDVEPDIMTQEEFEKRFGKSDELYKLYLQGMEVNKQRKELERKMEAVREKMAQGGEEQKDETKDVEDDDDEKLLKEFDNEIDSIKSKFQTSQGKLTRMSLQKNWEAELENVIKEAESELGVKVDRTLISGLSNTLDKLVNKLHDTQAEVKTMDNELEKLMTKKENERNEAEKNEDSRQQSEKEIQNVNPNKDISNVNEEITLPEVTENTDERQTDLRMNAEDKPTDLGMSTENSPANNGDLDESQGKTNDVDLEDKVVVKDEASKDETNKDGISTVEHGKKATSDQDVSDLPKDVQKLLEESLMKEYQKLGDDKPLSFDADHSFHKDNKMVHIIQDEDENGKKNRVIVVVQALDTFNDATSETSRQSQIEQNYQFTYKGKKKKDNLTPAS